MLKDGKKFVCGNGRLWGAAAMVVVAALLGFQAGGPPAEAAQGGGRAGQAARPGGRSGETAPAASLSIEEYQPRSTLKVPGRETPRAKYPVIDVHSHHRSMDAPRLETLVKEMDGLNLQIIVNLSGGTGERLSAAVRSFKETHPRRFAVFANLDFGDLNEPGFGQRAAERLQVDVKNGARGLKIFKNLGMDLKYTGGRRVPVDDPVLDPVWETCARLKIPVLIHTGEPWSFFQPMDRFNERWLELKLHPGRARPADRYPTWEALMAERDRLFARHPRTTFIIAHMGWMANDLEALGGLLDKLPNTYVEIGAILAELGRQPITARAWFIRYQDRVLFGKDAYRASEYPYYFRVMETRDEYFDYYRDYHAFWKLYGLDLPDEVLKKLYYKNALRVVPGLDASQFPQ